MSCAEWQARVARYVDGELPAEERDAFRAHMQGCPLCAAEALAAAEGKLAVRRAGQQYQASPEFRARISRLAAGKSQPALVMPTLPAREIRSRWSAVPQWAYAAVAVLLLAVGTFILFNQREQRQALTEFADLHVATLASANPVEVVSTDKHTVKPWFQGRIPFAFDLPDLGGTPFTLIGGRVAYVHQEPAAQLLFGYQKHMITAFVLRDSAQSPLEDGANNSSTFNMRSWRQNGLRYVVIGDVNPTAIQQLSDLLQHAR
jgi:anti-sigma factor RsiW